MRTQARERRGVVVVTVLVMLIVIVGFAALTIDVGYMYNVRADLQHTADSAALSAVQLLPDEIKARLAARDMAEMNLNGVVIDRDVVLGNWDWTTSVFTPNGIPVNAVHVYSQRSKTNGNPVGLFFAPILGVHQTDVSASATAALGRVKRWDVVIVQDVTGSFVDEIDEAREADQGLLDCIREHAPETHVGLVTFTGYGQVVAPLKSVTDQYSSLSAAISTINNCGKPGMPPCSGTNIGVGIDKAMELLGGSTTQRPKAIILVSDGMPNAGIPGYTNQGLANWAVDSANFAGDSEVSIFTLFYSGNDGTPGADDFLAGLVRKDGKAHQTPDPDSISTELQDICLEGMTRMLVE